MKKRILAAVLCAALCGCNSAPAETAVSTSETSVVTTETSLIKAEETSSAETTAAETGFEDKGDISDIGEPYLNEYQIRFPLFSSEIKANNKEYRVEAFLYNINNESEDTINGLTAIELSYNGAVLDRKNVYTNCGIVGPVYSKKSNDGYWRVISLENDVIAFIRSSDMSLYADAVFITINADEQLEWITRHFTDEEIAERKSEYYDRFTIPESRFFYVTGDYRITGNEIEFFHSDGSITALFDFENYQLLCGNEQALKVLYYQ